MTYFEGERFPLHGTWRPATAEEVDQVLNSKGNHAFAIEGVLKESSSGAGDQITAWCYRSEGSSEIITDGKGTVEFEDFMIGVVDCKPENEGSRIIYRVPEWELFFLYYLPA